MRAARVTVAAGAAVLLSLLLASATLASGPATRNRGTVTADCGGTTYTVVVENGGQNVGAVQVLDEFGHAILVDGLNSYWEVEGAFYLGYYPSGHGAGHGGQTTTTCHAEHLFLVSDLMGSAEAAFLGIPLSDHVFWQLDYVVVMKV